MKKIHYYMTRDKKTHTSEEKAIDHCLEKAHLALTDVLKEIGRADAYTLAQQIILKAQERAKPAIHEKLREVVVWLDNTVVERDDD